MSEVIKKYFLVTKPGIIFGNLITAAGGFFLAAKGQIDTAVLLPTLSGICLVVASGCVFNNCIDKNMDRKMVRTRNRVLAQGRMSTKFAVFYASLLGIAGAALLRAATNMLSVAIVLAGFTIYVGVYSLYLKRNSVYGTLIGSLAGAAPPLAGYCAVSGRFDMGALILLSIFSLWQMPHCYAIAIFRWDDYAAAQIPVLPLKQAMPVVKMHILGYIVAFIAATLMLAFGGYAGYSYLAVAAALGLYWLYLAWSGYKTSDDRLWAKKLFVFSILSIFILSVMMSIDAAVPAAWDMLLTYGNSAF
jgi:protoheme IX farnesyltransferase